MAHTSLEVRDLSFAYDGREPLFDGISFSVGPGWTGIVGPNGSGKSSLLALIAGDLEPDAGAIVGSRTRRLVPQDDAVDFEDLEVFLLSYDERACRLKDVLGLDESYTYRWETLSYGERRRAQLAAAVYSGSEVLLVDEPTNHLDGPGRIMVADALALHEGIGLVVSHDRALLNRICRRTMFLSASPGPESVQIHQCSYDAALGEREREELADRRRHDRARQEYQRLKAELERRARDASRADGRVSKRGLGYHDKDRKARIDLARVTGKDAAAGRFQKRLEGRVARAERELELGHGPRRSLRDLGSFGKRPEVDFVIRLPAGELPLGPGRSLVHGELEIGGGDLLIIRGPNGSGKSTLIRRLLSLCTLTTEDVMYLPQELPRSEQILGRLEGMAGHELARVMGLFRDLGGDPELLRRGTGTSMGEARKLVFALGMAGDPGLVVLDEPANHLDLGAIRRIECALAESPSTRIVVTHDETLARRLGGRVFRTATAEGAAGTAVIRLESA